MAVWLLSKWETFHKKAKKRKKFFVRLSAFVFSIFEKTKNEIFFKWTFEYLKILFDSIFLFFLFGESEVFVLESLSPFFLSKPILNCIETKEKRQWNSILNGNEDPKSINTLYCFRDFRLMKAISFVEFKSYYYYFSFGERWVFKINPQFCGSIILRDFQKVQERFKRDCKGFY